MVGSHYTPSDFLQEGVGGEDPLLISPLFASQGGERICILRAGETPATQQQPAEVAYNSQACLANR